MMTFSIIIVTAFFIGLANVCPLVPCSGNEIITSIALIKGTCEFIQPVTGIQTNGHPFTYGN